MNVLTLVESFFIGGLETRIHGEFRWARENGIGTFLAMSDNFLPDNLPDASLGIVTGLDISENTSSAALLRTVERLVNIVRMHRIDIIHVHPFSVLWPGFLVSQLAKVPLVVSLHGPVSLSPAQRGIQWRLQMAFVLPYASTLACVSKEVYDLAQELAGHDRCRVFQNCVDVDRFFPRSHGRAGCWALIGRLDEDKKNGISAFFRMLPYLPIERVDIVGDGACRLELEKSASALGLKDRRIHFLGIKTNVNGIMDKYDGIIGMGRVALEAMAKELPLILLGNDGVKGGVDIKRFREAAYANFSGRGLENKIATDVRHWLELGENGMELSELRKIVHENFRDDSLWRKFYNDAKSLKFNKCHLFPNIISIIGECKKDSVAYSDDTELQNKIELMIHQQENNYLTDGANKNSIQDITGVLAMARGWRLGRMAENEVRFSSALCMRDKEIERIRNTVSWQLTRPLRGIYWALKKFRRTFARH